MNHICSKALRNCALVWNFTQHLRLAPHSCNNETARGCMQRSHRGDDGGVSHARGPPNRGETAVYPARAPAAFSHARGGVGDSGAAAFVARRRRDALRSVTARPLLFSREEPRFLSFSSRALASRLTASTRPAACADGDSLLLSSAHASVAGPVCLQGKDSGCVI